MTPSRATVVITTKNRKAELRTALRSAVAQTAEPEVLVVDDGSTDGTAEMVAEEFPGVRLERSETSLGYIRQRNRAAQLATGEVIVSIDDDAEFSSPVTVEATLRDFDHPRIAAVAIPFVHTLRSPAILQRPPDAHGRWVTGVFIGTAHALRRDVFLASGAYREAFVHFFEEVDWALRLLGLGYVVRLGRAAPILHHESPARDVERHTRMICRGHALVTWWDVPMPHALLRAAELAAYVPAYGISRRHPRAALAGIGDAVRTARHSGEPRDPLPEPLYRAYRRLRRRPRPLEAIEPVLPEPSGAR